MLKNSQKVNFKIQDNNYLVVRITAEPLLQYF